MPIHFKIDERLAGYAAATAKPGEIVPICYRELIGPLDALHLQQQLDQLQGTLFSKIPSLPDPSIIHHLLVLIRPDLSCTAYVNELNILDKVKVNRSVKRGELIYARDVADVADVDLNVEIPQDFGVVFVRSLGWRRSLFFDFGPLLPDIGPRTNPIEKAFAQQSLLLLGIPSTIESPEGFTTQLQHMENGLSRLKQLLMEQNESESVYQELLEEHPWMLGGLYSEINRHSALDDQRIPDFTAIRCYDHCLDIIEIKQPFLKLFRKKGGYAAAFNDAWNQAESYISFAVQQRSYLYEEKELRFENPRCILLLGYNLTPKKLREIRKKEGLGRIISVFTYDHLVKTASHVYSLMCTANERTVSAIPQEPMANQANAVDS
ncbi:MAG: Shedu anti-phage system protein SduA domain-containing protein [Pseudomonadota bacterium]